MEESTRICRLAPPPDGLLDVVLDTDMANEADDPFALAYLMLYPARVRLRAVLAAPFFHDRVESPRQGMEASAVESERLLRFFPNGGSVPVYRGSPAFLQSETEPVPSEAVERLVALALAQPADRPLYVVAIAALTNIASALLRCPEIAERIVVVWLGGHARDWPDTREFNLISDPAAARVVFGSGVPLVQLPCRGVASHLICSRAELEFALRDKNPLCDELLAWMLRVLRAETPGDPGLFWSRTLWDVAASTWLLRPDLTGSLLVPTPLLAPEGYYASAPARPPMRYVYFLQRDGILADLFTRLADFSCAESPQ